MAELVPATYFLEIKKSGGNVHQAIRDHVNDEKVNETIVSYFKSNIVNHIRPLSIPDLLGRLRTIVNRDLNIPQETKKTLLEFADEEHLAEFLARMFQYIVPLENVPKEGTEI